LDVTIDTEGVKCSLWPHQICIKKSITVIYFVYNPNLNSFRGIFQVLHIVLYHQQSASNTAFTLQQGVCQPVPWEDLIKSNKHRDKQILQR